MHATYLLSLLTSRSAGWQRCMFGVDRLIDALVNSYHYTCDQSARFFGSRRGCAPQPARPAAQRPACKSSGGLSFKPRCSATWCWCARRTAACRPLPRAPPK